MSKNGELRREDTCAMLIEHTHLKDTYTVSMRVCDEIEESKEWMLTEV